ncbi:hypothetical protein AXG93_4278s1010 [Marchantia polymorpha subsp. ruderalis]|uniref:Protein kinase domain-containing protein n=1 Tax=Marchantia polymorpha subsp. ruderalis TaxID=1480154 RepID=A0A176W3J5_MARPO|nr:hypothetical protein AXG93_4278s1010 [Marchantia polymorpha subsp. ruderalis]
MMLIEIHKKFFDWGIWKTRITFTSNKIIFPKDENRGVTADGDTLFTDKVASPKSTWQFSAIAASAWSFHGGNRRSIHSGSTGRGAPEWTIYNPEEFSRYYRFRPFPVIRRATVIIVEMLLLGIGQTVEKDIQKRAARLRRSLIRLGPFYIKLGQALSTRPDILPTAYCQELAKLQDQIPPYPTSTALEFLEVELGAPASQLYAYITPEPVAAASLGQVYKARLHSGESVAVKVQRPGVTGRLALDAHLLRLLGPPLQRFAGARSDLLAMLNEMVERMFEEVDYVREGRYAERFAKLYGIPQEDDGHKPIRGAERIRLKNSETSIEGVVKVPKVYWPLSSKGVLTMEWIDGLKLTDGDSLRKANLNTTQVVDQGVFCSLRQLLEEGFFHADPHPGNLVVTKEGVLAYFDFGMMSEIRREYRIGLIRTIIHFVNRDSVGLAKDFQTLGFLPQEIDIAPIAKALNETFGDEGTKSQLDFQGIMTQLSDVMYQFNFRLPPEYAMVIRALGSLEGTATVLDPEFKVVASAYPFIVGRLLADPDPEMREILRELLIRNNGSIRWHRLERLVFAIAEQSTSISDDPSKAKRYSVRDGLGRRAAAGIKGAFNTRAVASATMDVLEFILSGKGTRVRTLLVQDITQTSDLLLQQYIAQYLDFDELYHNFRDKSRDSSTSSKVDEEDDTQYSKPQGNPLWQLYPWGFSREGTSSSFPWSRYTTANVWGKKPGKSLRGTRLWQQEMDADTKLKAATGEKITPRPKMSTKDGTADGGHKRSLKDPGTASSSQTPKDEEKVSDSFGGRVKVGFQAFANAVSSAPEIWIPLMARLASKPEARSLGSDVASSLLEVYRHRTSEASFLAMSKALHEKDRCKQASCRV